MPGALARNAEGQVWRVPRRAISIALLIRLSSSRGASDLALRIQRQSGYIY